MNTQASAALAVGLMAIPVAAATGHPVASRTARAMPRTAGLTISVTDGRGAATAGDRLTYTVRVRDTGIAAAPHLKITQTLSPGLEFLSASGHGVATAGQVAWRASLPAGGTRTFRLTALVTRTSALELRLAAVACVALPGGGRPIVCAAHLDQLPAAAAAPAARPASSSGHLPVYAAGGLAVLAAGLLTAIAGRRMRPKRRQA